MMSYAQQSYSYERLGQPIEQFQEISVEGLRIVNWSKGTCLCHVEKIHTLSRTIFELHIYSWHDGSYDREHQVKRVQFVREALTKKAEIYIWNAPNDSYLLLDITVRYFSTVEVIKRALKKHFGKEF